MVLIFRIGLKQVPTKTEYNSHTGQVLHAKMVLSSPYTKRADHNMHSGYLLLIVLSYRLHSLVKEHRFLGFKKGFTNRELMDQKLLVDNNFIIAIRNGLNLNPN